MTTTDLDAKAEAALLIARGAGADKAGEAVGRSGRTIRRWRQQDPEFEAEIQAARREVLDQAVNALGGAARDAVTALHAALKDESVHARIRAAAVLLSSLPGLFTYLDLEHRLAALEAGMTEGNEL